MGDCKSREEYIALKEEIDKMAGDIALSAEIRVFTPEIMARHILRYGEGDSLFLMVGDDRVEFKKTQLRSYFYIQQVIFDYHTRVKPEKEQVMRIVANSASFKEIQKAVQEGHEPTDMYAPGTTYKIDVENYQVW